MASIKDNEFGPIFGKNSDLKIKLNKVYSNYHIFRSAYEKDINIDPKILFL